MNFDIRDFINNIEDHFKKAGMEEKDIIKWQEQMTTIVEMNELLQQEPLILAGEACTVETLKELIDRATALDLTGEATDAISWLLQVHIGEVEPSAADLCSPNANIRRMASTLREKKKEYESRANR